MKSILIAADFPFWDESSGGSRRLAEMLRYLHGCGYHLSIFFRYSLRPSERRSAETAFPWVKLYTPEQCGSGDLSLQREARKMAVADCLPQPLVRCLVGLKRAMRGGEAPAGNEERGIDSFESPRHRAAFQALCRTLKPDVVIIEYPRLAYVTEGVEQSCGAKTVLDTIDVHFLRAERARTAGRTAGLAISRDEELGILRRFDLVVAIQEAERKIFEKLLPGHPVITAAHPSTIHEKEQERENPQQVELLFVGAAASHNLDAVEFFLGEVWPRVIRKCPTLHFRIVGRVCDLLEGDVPPNVELAGLVENLDATYRRAHIAINPAMIGSGLKIKTVEALCQGMPLVTTPIGAEGLPPFGEVPPFLIADDAEGFVSALGDLISSYEMRNQLSAAAHRYAEEHFAPSTVYHELVSWIEGGAG